MPRQSAPRVRDRIVRAPSAPQRALFLINDLTMGGAQRSFVNFVNHLRRIRPVVVLVESAADLLGELNPDLELFSLDEREPTPMPAAERQALATASRRPRRRPRGQTLLELPGVLRKARRLARLARATDAYVVSPFLNRSHTVALLSKFLFAPRLRVVINVHEVSGHVKAHFSPGERQLMSAFIRHGFPRAERIIAVSDSVRDDLVRRFSIPIERITVVPNPIDLTRIRRVSEETVAGVKPGETSALIVAVGRLVRLKGFDVLIRAFASLPQFLQARLLIIGDGQERAALQRLAAELRVANRVELMGNQVNPWKYMARANVIAVPSRAEAFPNVIGEALALSVPVVATLCSEGVTEYLEGGRCGLLVPPDDAPALAEALERVLTDADLRRRLAQQGAPRVEAFDLPDVVQRYERLILEVGQG
jgi:glycosyltransferase involved in cell wall biosynthesis